MESRLVRSLTSVLLLLGAQAALAQSNPVRWVWSGALTSRSVVVKAKIEPGWGVPRLVLGDRTLSPEGTDSNGVFTFPLQDLAAGTEYEYRVEVNGASYRAGRFRTVADGPMSFRFVFGSCASTGSNHEVFQSMEGVAPLFTLHMGDFHYENIQVNDVELYRHAFDAVLASRRQSSLYRSAPIAYIWDDHDFGPNDADGTHVGKPAALAAYDEAVPHYPLVRDRNGAPVDLRQAFSIGRVRFLLTDVRSHRSADDQPDGPGKTMLGADQREWLLREMETAAPTHALLVWVNVVPWIVEAGSGHGWGRYDWERRFLADRIRALGVVNRVVVVSGDGHMVAIDDGRNSNFARDAAPGEPAFPVVHAAPFDRYARQKGGPYSHGIAGRRVLFGLVAIQQFGLADVVDDGKVLEISLSGRNKKGELLDGMSLRMRCEDGCRIMTAEGR